MASAPSTPPSLCDVQSTVREGKAWGRMGGRGDPGCDPLDGGHRAERQHANQIGAGRVELPPGRHVGVGDAMRVEGGPQREPGPGPVGAGPPGQRGRQRIVRPRRAAGPTGGRRGDATAPRVAQPIAASFARAAQRRISLADRRVARPRWRRVAQEIDHERQTFAGTRLAMDDADERPPGDAARQRQLLQTAGQQSPVQQRIHHAVDVITNAVPKYSAADSAGNGGDIRARAAALLVALAQAISAAASAPAGVLPRQIASATWLLPAAWTSATCASTQYRQPLTAETAGERRPAGTADAARERAPIQPRRVGAPTVARLLSSSCPGRRETRRWRGHAPSLRNGDAALLDLAQRRTLVRGDMLGLVALDF